MAEQEKVRVEVERFGPDDRAIARVLRGHARHADVKGRLAGKPRLLALTLPEPSRKTARPAEPDRYRATWFDYTRNRALHVDGRLSDPQEVAVTESADHPLPTREEFEAAVAVLSEDPALGPAVRDGALVPYAPMPPLVGGEQPDGSIERTIAVGLRPADKRRRRQHEILGVNLVRGEVERFPDRAPALARADDQICQAPPSAGQPTTDQSTAGQAWVNVFFGAQRVWRFLVVRPSASSGTYGSGIELRFVDYRGRRVLYQAHVPILNVLYDGNACGPYRDWQYQEGMIDAAGANVAPGFLLASSPAKTILDTGSDSGTFLGTAIYVDGLEVVLVCEMHAGWYRYVSEWRLHVDGTIRPRFGFDATASSCVCNRHHHHVYWRLDFDIETAGGNEVREFNDPPIVGGASWHTMATEIMRLRDSPHHRRWRVANRRSGRGYDIVPGPNDGTAAGDAYAKGDLWFLRYHPGEIDDEPIVGTEIQIDKYRNGESLAGQDVVAWYGAHFTHDVSGPEVEHVVGPELRPHGW
jgi:hypothetical protein